MNKTKEKKSARENWLFLKDRLNHAYSSNREFVDAMHLRIDYDPYLQELGQNKSINKNGEHNVIKLTPEELAQRELHYDEQSKKLLLNGQIADTTGLISKNISDLAAFIMDMDGKIYINQHIVDKDASFFHGSFLNDRSAEMSGMISIKDGKILYLNNNSGHYAPDILDIYRGVKKLKSRMPEAFAQEFCIEVTDSNGVLKCSLNYFLNHMEQDIKGKPLFEIIRDRKKQVYTNYKIYLDSIYLFKAIDENNIDQLEKYLKKDYLKATMDSHFNTPLAKAVISGNEEVENILFTNGFNALNSNIIHNLVKYNNLDAIERILRKYASISQIDINKLDSDGFSAVNIAVGLGRGKIFAKLIENGAIVFPPLEEGQPLLIWAIENLKFKLAANLIKNNIGINAKDKYGETALAHAINYCNFEVAKDLIIHGANINEKMENDDTALMRAAEICSSEIIELLIEKSALVNEKNRNGETALMIAAYNCDVSSVELLIKAGADINAVDKDGFSALSYVVDLSDYEMANILVSLGADVNCKTRAGMTPLMKFINISEDFVRNLIYNGANLNAIDDNGNNALTYALNENNHSAANILIYYGAELINQEFNLFERGYDFENIAKDLAQSPRAAGSIIRLLRKKDSELYLGDARFSNFISQVVCNIPKDKLENVKAEIKKVAPEIYKKEFIKILPKTSGISPNEDKPKEKGAFANRVLSNRGERGVYERK